MIRFVVISYLYICLLFACFGSSASDSSKIASIIEKRLQILRNIIESEPIVSTCSRLSYVIIPDEGDRELSKQLILFTHGLWLSKTFARTFVIPTWMSYHLHTFNLTELEPRFCYTFEQKTGYNSIRIRSRVLMLLPHLFMNRNYQDVLPKLSTSIISNISEQFLVVSAGLWAYPPSDIIDASIDLISHKFAGSFNFSAVHKRSFNGGCTQILLSRTRPEEFPPDQLSLRQPGWASGNHPLCEMPPAFILATEELNHRNAIKQHKFICSDDHDNLNAYQDMDFASGRDLNENKFPMVGTQVGRLMADMFLSMHADFFIMNPYSSVSWDIYINRIMLGLDSVPVLANRDLFFHALNVDADILWVNWVSIREANDRIKSRIAQTL